MTPLVTPPLLLLLPPLAPDERLSELRLTRRNAEAAAAATPGELRIEEDEEEEESAMLPFDAEAGVEALMATMRSLWPHGFPVDTLKTLMKPEQLMFFFATQLCRAVILIFQSRVT